MYCWKVIDRIGALMNDLGALLGDAHIQRPANRFPQTGHERLAEAVCWLLRMDSRAKEGFVGINISDAGND